MIRPNIILDVDSYKLAHWDMMADGTSAAFSNFGARPGGLDELCVVGLQPILMEEFEGERVTNDLIVEAKSLQSWHMPGTRFNLDGWKYIVEHHNGRLPIAIKAAPEGMVLPAGVPLLSVRNTGGPLTAFLTDYVEDLLFKVWYPTIIASKDFAARVRFLRLAQQSGVAEAVVDYIEHDFGYRAVSSEQSAGIGGMAHLVNFNGTDTIKGMRYAMYYYGANPGMAHSVAATQHSIATGMGEAGEHIVSMRVVNKFQNQIVSEVADSYDYKRFVHRMIDSYKEIKAARVKLVIRPDSLVGDLDTPVKVVLWTLHTIANRFAGLEQVTTTPTGHKVLPYSVLYGDGIDQDDAIEIATAAVEAGFALSNLVFGSGGGLLQRVERDMARFKYAASATERDGVWHNQNKAAQGKVSMGGLLTTRYNPLTDTYYAVDERTPDYNPEVLLPVFKDGVILHKYTFDYVRNNARREASKRATISSHAAPERTEPGVPAAQA